MALAGVKGSVGGDAADLLFGRDLVQQFGQHGRVTDIAGGELRRPDFQCFLINPPFQRMPAFACRAMDVKLALYAPLCAAMLAGVPLAFPLDLDAGAVDQQVQRAVLTAVGNVHLQGLLAPRQRAEVWHGPVQADQSQQALSEPGRLAEGHAEQHLHRQAGLDGGIAVVGLAATFTGRSSLPGHGGIKPDCERAAALERFVIGWPVPGLKGEGDGSAHSLQLPHWIHKMNPTQDLCNRASPPQFDAEVNLGSPPRLRWTDKQNGSAIS